MTLPVFLINELHSLYIAIHTLSISVYYDYLQVIQPIYTKLAEKALKRAADMAMKRKKD